LIFPASWSCFNFFFWSSHQFLIIRSVTNASAEMLAEKLVTELIIENQGRDQNIFCSTQWSRDRKDQSLMIYFFLDNSSVQSVTCVSCIVGCNFRPIIAPSLCPSSGWATGQSPLYSNCAKIYCSTMVQASSGEFLMSLTSKWHCSIHGVEIWVCNMIQFCEKWIKFHEIITACCRDETACTCLIFMEPASQVFWSKNVNMYVTLSSHQIFNTTWTWVRNSPNCKGWHRWEYRCQIQSNLSKGIPFCVHNLYNGMVKGFSQILILLQIPSL
jgi:hypothetical protein